MIYSTDPMMWYLNLFLQIKILYNTPNPYSITNKKKKLRVNLIMQWRIIFLIAISQDKSAFIASLHFFFICSVIYMQRKHALNN